MKKKITKNQIALKDQVIFNIFNSICDNVTNEKALNLFVKRLKLYVTELDVSIKHENYETKNSPYYSVVVESRQNLKRFIKERKGFVKQIKVLENVVQQFKKFNAKFN